MAFLPWIAKVRVLQVQGSFHSGLDAIWGYPEQVQVLSLSELDAVDGFHGTNSTNGKKCPEGTSR